jgi:hypothetical protein
MSNLTFPEAFKIVQAHEPALASALLNTSDIVSCKNLKKLWAIISYDYADAVDVVVTWNESTDVAGGTTAAISATCPIWYNIDTATADLLARATDAATFTILSATGKNQLWIVEWDPAKFSAGYDCFQIRMAGACAGLIDVLYVAEPRYQSDVVPTAITD